MRENRPSGLEGGVAVTRHPYPYIIAQGQRVSERRPGFHAPRILSPSSREA